MKFITNKYLLISTLSVLCILFLTAQTPYEIEQSQVLLSPEEQELNALTYELVQLDNSSKLEALIDQKQEIQAQLDEMKKHESEVKQVHNQFKKIKLSFKSLKEECTFSECRNVLRYTVTNNSNQTITNIGYQITIKSKGKVLYSAIFNNKEERSLLPGASYKRHSEFSDSEMYDMIIPKGATTTLTLVAFQTDFQDWHKDYSEEYQSTLTELKKKLSEAEVDIAQYKKNIDIRRNEIVTRIAQLKP